MSSRIERTASISRAPVSQRGHVVPVSSDPEAIGGTVSVTIDGIETKVPLGTTVLDAARSLGLKIPTLCHHPDLEVGYNNCRVRFTTHAIRGLSENDFICAAKIDLIPLA